MINNVLVTGAGRGLGLAISRRLIAEGYCVIGIGRTLSQEFRNLIDSNLQSRNANFICFDLNDLAGIPGLIASITKQFGPIYGLVNNAAIGVDGFLATMHASEISQTLRVNLEAPILLAKFACRSMLNHREGRVINISSIIATTGFSGLSVYGATKAGLIGFSRSLSRELGRVGITVNCVSPGFMSTEMTSGLADEKLDIIKRRAPLGLAEPDDAAGAVVYLLSPDARRITGTCIVVDGGSTA